MSSPHLSDVLAVQTLDAIPTILKAVVSLTGLRFVCVARVTPDSWTTCAVLDQLEFGLQPGDELDISTTLCEEVRSTAKAIIIDEVRNDPKYRDHPTPKIYGFQSYISIPIVRRNGEYFGTLCGLDPLPAKLNNTATVSSMTMFAALIACQLTYENKLQETQRELLDERKTAELREQFIAILGHDIRNPLHAILTAAEALSLMPEVRDNAASMAQLIKRCAKRIDGIVGDVVDFTKGNMGSGITLKSHNGCIAEALLQVVAELQLEYPEREIITEIAEPLILRSDAGRLAQLLSNLLKNALLHGDPQAPVNVRAEISNGILQISVTNTGKKLSPNIVAQLFKPFWRSTASASKEGLGLGLFIVAEIARAHGGNINVLSEDQQTAFIFSMKTEHFSERRIASSDTPFADRRKTSLK